MRIESPVRRRNLISLTPLIDVVFILLVFFMLASSFLDWRQISIGMATTSAYGREQDISVTVHMRSDGSVQLGGETLAVPEVVERLRRELAAQGQPVFVQPAGNVELQQIVNLLEQLSRGGIDNVSLREE